MITPCPRCTKPYQCLPDSRANDPGRLCPTCWEAERQRVADPRYVPTTDEAARHPDEFTEGMEEFIP